MTRKNIEFVDVVLVEEDGKIDFHELQDNEQERIDVGEEVDLNDGFRRIRFYSTPNSAVEDLQITWKTLVRYRDLAMDNGAFNRVVLYSDVILDLATMIQVAGAELPKLPVQ